MGCRWLPSVGEMVLPTVILIPITISLPVIKLANYVLPLRPMYCPTITTGSYLILQERIQC